MSWLRGYSASSKVSESESREEKRRRLEAERLARAQQRNDRQKQLQAAIQARQEADQALRELCDIDPEIFAETSVLIPEDEVENLLEESAESIMADFDQENGSDGKSALGDLKAVQCPFMKNDIEFWFGQLEGQLEVIEIKSQWVKRIAVQRFLPPEIQEEVKGLLSLGKTAAGNDIYYKIKRELIDLFGRKPEDAYTRAKNRVLSGKPSQLGKALINDLCKKDKKLDGCCCGDIVWGMFREKLPIVVRNHIAELAFNKDTYKAIFTKADQVWDSNQASDPMPSRPVAAVTAQASTQNEVAAMQKNKNQKNKNKKNKGQGQDGQSQSQSGQGQSGQGQSETKKKINDEGLCRIHAKWKNNATFCAAPWGCSMKNVYKAPQ